MKYYKKREMLEPFNQASLTEDQKLAWNIIGKKKVKTVMHDLGIFNDKKAENLGMHIYFEVSKDERVIFEELLAYKAVS